MTHPLAEVLRQHLLRWRGGWVTKLTPELQLALGQIEETDIRRAAATLLHGPAICAAGRDRSIVRIADGWKFCGNGRVCPCFMEHFLATSEATNFAKRGVANAAQAADVKEKIRDTCLDRYGVPNTGSLVSRRETAEATNLVRYGAKNVFASDEIKAVIRDKTQLNHGVDHISHSPEHQVRMRAGVRATWGVSNVARHPVVQAKIQATNLLRYGGVAPACSPVVRHKMKQTMEQRFGGHIAQLHILPQHRIIDQTDFARRFTGRRAGDIAAETGYDPSLIHRYAYRWNIELDYTGGDHRAAENAFADCLAREIMPPERNVDILIPEGKDNDRRCWQQIDNYFPTHRLGVEFGGAIWHSEAFGRDRAYHAKKRLMALRQNITLLQVFEDEWIDHPEAVIATIRHRLGLTTHKTYARSCVLGPISHHEAAGFYDIHHVFGRASATVHLGLRSQHDLVACMSFTERTSAGWELVRYASKNSVVGGASRLLCAFERMYNWQTIKSFVDLRWSMGALYTILGFTVEKEIAPDYMYVIANRRIHKFNLRKSSKRFAKYVGTGMTERQMAIAEQIPRVYDAGKWRVVKCNPAFQDMPPDKKKPRGRKAPRGV